MRFVMLFIAILSLPSVQGHNNPKEIIEKFSRNRGESQSGRSGKSLFLRRFPSGFFILPGTREAAKMAAPHVTAVSIGGQVQRDC